MGDFRFSFKAEFQMGDFKDECDMWLNWSPDGWHGEVDHRVIEWLENCFEAGVADIRNSQYDAELKDSERKKEAAERAEYERLKLKFGNDS